MGALAFMAVCAAALAWQGPVVHVIVVDDLDCAAYAREVRGVLEGTTGASLVVLEVRSDRSRTDLSWEVAQGVLACASPVAVFLGDGMVHAEMLGVGIVGTTCHVRTGARLASSGSLRGMAPEGTDWESVEREFSGVVWVRLRERGVDQRLAGALTGVGEACWLVREGGAARVEWERPVRGEERRELVSGSGEVSMVSRDAVELGLCAGEVRGVGEVIAHHGLRGVSVRKREVRSGLGEARARVLSVLERSAVEAEEIERLLQRPRSSEAVVSPAKRRERVGRALELSRSGLERLGEAEALVVEYPEVMASPAPNQTVVGESRAAREGAWRRVFQSRRDRLEALRVRAEEEAAR